MTKPELIRVGIVGIGNWARYGHIPVLKLLPAYEITALSSRDLVRGAALAQEFSIPRVFDDPATLISDPEVDLVLILPPAPQHAALVRSAIAAGKDVYCEWPLATNIADSEDLLARATAAGTRHVVGLQRRLGPSARYVRDLLAQSYVGEVRSVRMNVSMNSFSSRRSEALAWTIPLENFSHPLSIYGGHFMDMLFNMVGAPKSVSALVRTQFPTITIEETKRVYSNSTPDQTFAIGELTPSGVFDVHIEAGNLTDSGLQIDIVGTDGSLRISNEFSFQNPRDNIVQGSQTMGAPLRDLPIPPAYRWLPPSQLDSSVLDLAYVYAAFADRSGKVKAPDFHDALRIHRFIDAICQSSARGSSLSVNL